MSLLPTLARASRRSLRRGSLPLLRRLSAHAAAASPDPPAIGAAGLQCWLRTDECDVADLRAIVEDGQTDPSDYPWADEVE